MKPGAGLSSRPSWPKLHVGIGTKITLLLCAIAVLASGTVGVITYWQFNQTLVDHELQELSSLARAKAVRFTSEMEALRSDVLFVTHSPVVQRLARAHQAGGVDPESGETEQALLQRIANFCQELLEAKPTYSQVRLIGVADGGREIVRVDRDFENQTPRVAPQDELQELGGEIDFSAALRLTDGDVYLSDVNLNREKGHVAIPLPSDVRAAAPIFGSDGRPIAILVIHRAFQPIAMALREGLSENQTLLVTNGRGEYLVHPDVERTFGFDRGKPARIQDDYAALSGVFDVTKMTAHSAVEESKFGQRVALGVDRAPFDPSHPNRFLAIVVATPYDETIVESVRSRNRSLMAGVVVVFIAVVCGYYISRSVTEPLREITSAAQAFGRGETNAILPTGNHDEIGVVARSLAGMMSEVQVAHADLKRRAEQLEESRRSALNIMQDVEANRTKAVEAERAEREHSARLQAIFDGATDAIITINSTGTIEASNKAVEKIFGYPVEELIGKDFSILMPSPYREEHDGCLQKYSSTGVSKVVGMGREVIGLRADRTTFPMHLAVSEVKLGDRRLFTGIVRDLTDVMLAKRQLAAVHDDLAQYTRQIERFNVELKRSNEELKQFAFVASHDLQEPLRKIAAFCQLLQDEYGHRLDDNARTYINYAVDGALRMKALIQDLLAYSRVEIQGKPLEPTDADDACAEAIDNLAVAIEETAAAVTREPLPVVQADRDQLVRLFQNLIGNAIKYRSDLPPRIHIRAAESGDDWVFHIRDNGIGIDPQYSERIFVIFQRLHGHDEYSGTGIGLAICKRIVGRAGGRIWVESSEGAGSEFCFTLSKAVTAMNHGGPSYDRHSTHFVCASD